MQIEVHVFRTPVAEKEPGPHGPGWRFSFSDDLYVVSVDGTPLPANTRVGTHSGFITTLRVAKVGDNYFSKDDELFQYQATYVFDGPNLNLPAALPRGQLLVGGVFWELKAAGPAQPRTFAITGGTGPYSLARGQLTEAGPDRTLTVTL
jgi:hypothetical protein